jgi:hypothetical protein
MRTITATLLLAFILLLAATLRRESPWVEIHNDSERPVAAVEIEVGRQRAGLPGLGPGESRRQPLTLHADGPLRVRVRFAGGETVTGQGGYLTPGMMGVNRLSIDGPDSVVISTRPAPDPR